jgi:chromosome segregation ATPase
VFRDFDSSSCVLDCCSQELQGRARAKYDRLTQLSSDLDWYRGQYEALDAFVEALRTDNGWLEYRLRVMQDALLDQCALTTEGTTTVDRVKTALLERDEALAMTNGNLQKARAALAEVQTAMAEKETAFSTAQTQLQQDCITLEGAQSWQAQAKQKAKEAERLGADLQVKVTLLAAME